MRKILPSPGEITQDHPYETALLAQLREGARKGALETRINPV